MRHAVQLITLLLSLATLPNLQAQSVITTPGNGGTLTATLRYIDTGRACVACPVQWGVLTPNQLGVQTGYHYHSATGAPPGRLYNIETSTDANGNARAQWTSELANVDGYPTGYAMQFGVQACSSVSRVTCEAITIRTMYSGLNYASTVKGWFKTSDSAHQSQNYTCSYQFCIEFNQIATNYFNSNAGKYVMVTRMSLPLGGIYDGVLFMPGLPYWQASYAGQTVYGGGEDHMFGDEADVSMAGMLSADITKLAKAVAATPGQNGAACEAWPGIYNTMHIYCGGSGPGE